MDFYFYNKITNGFRQLKLDFKEISFSNKLYIFGMLLLAVFIVIRLFSLFPEEENSDSFIVNILSGVAVFVVILSCFVVVLEFVKILVIVYDETWFKWITGFITMILYAVSGVYMDGFNNESVGIDPSLLPVASTISTLFFLIPCWLFFISIFIFAFIILGLSHSDVGSNDNKLDSKIFKELKGMFRILGWVFLLLSTSSVIDMFSDKESILVSYSRNIILLSEYFNKTHCTNVQEKEISADIGRGYISIYNIEAKEFRTEECLYKAFKNKT